MRAAVHICELYSAIWGFIFLCSEPSRPPPILSHHRLNSLPENTLPFFFRIAKFGGGDEYAQGGYAVGALPVQQVSQAFRFLIVFSC